MTLQEVLDDLAIGAAKAKTFLQAVAASPITAEAETIIPGLARIVAGFTPVGNVLGALAAAEQLEQALVAMGAKPIDANEMARIHRDLEEQ